MSLAVRFSTDIDSDTVPDMEEIEEIRNSIPQPDARYEMQEI